MSMKNRNKIYIRSMRILACCLAAIMVVPGALRGDDKKEAKLSFSMSEGETMHYETSWATETNFSGMDIVQNESYEVDMKLMKVTEEGNYRLSMEFVSSSSSMIIDDDIREWSPTMKLEGKSIMADVASNGEVLEVKPGGNIPGMRSIENLKDIVEVWFIDLPDTVKQVGASWRRDIEKGGGETKDGEKIEPKAKGFSDLHFKKMQKKKGIPVAVIEIETRLDINQRTPGGVLRGKAKGKGKYCIAVDGGYVVEGKSEFELKGTVVSDDGSETDTAVTRYYETKLKK